MDRDYPLYPMPAALAVTIRDGRVLLVRRRAEPEPRKWGFPGGLVEAGENPLQAALRELLEETHISAQPGPLLDVFDFIKRDDQGKVRNHYLMLAGLCLHPQGKAAAGDDALEAAWFDLPLPVDLPVHPDVPRLIDAALKTVKSP